MRCTLAPRVLQYQGSAQITHTHISFESQTGKGVYQTKQTKVGKKSNFLASYRSPNAPICFRLGFPRSDSIFSFLSSICTNCLPGIWEVVQYFDGQRSFGQRAPIYPTFCSSIHPRRLSLSVQMAYAYHQQHRGKTGCVSRGLHATTVVIL